ncbi:hypothetical protein D3C80_1868770 [compost metagenome]
MLRIQRQLALQQEDREQQHEAGQVEGQQGQGVLLPVLFLVKADTRQAIAGPLQRTEQW